MIAHARNRKTPLQRQTAQHVTNRRAELFLGSGGEEIACLREIFRPLGSNDGSVRGDPFATRRGCLCAVAFFRRPASVRTGG